MKVLVIFYSLDGNTRLVAESIAREAGADLAEVKRKKDFRYKGFLKIFLGGFQAILNKKPEILPLDKNPEGYDLIFVGTPVWAGRSNPVFNTLFSGSQWKEKSVALFCCFGGNEGKTFTGLKKLLDRSIFIGEKGFKMPLKQDKAGLEEEVRQWIQSVLKSV